MVSPSFWSTRRAATATREPWSWGMNPGDPGVLGTRIGPVWQALVLLHPNTAPERSTGSPPASFSVSEPLGSGIIWRGERRSCVMFPKANNPLFCFFCPFFIFSLLSNNLFSSACVPEINKCHQVCPAPPASRLTPRRREKTGKGVGGGERGATRTRPSTPPLRQKEKPTGGGGEARKSLERSPPLKPKWSHWRNRQGFTGRSRD